jgi:hypothetical protein
MKEESTAYIQQITNKFTHKINVALEMTLEEVFKDEIIIAQIVQETIKKLSNM